MGCLVWWVFGWTFWFLTLQSWTRLRRFFGFWLLLDTTTQIGTLDLENGVQRKCVCFNCWACRIVWSLSSCRWLGSLRFTPYSFCPPPGRSKQSKSATGWESKVIQSRWANRWPCRNIQTRTGSFLRRSPCSSSRSSGCSGDPASPRTWSHSEGP